MGLKSIVMFFRQKNGKIFFFVIAIYQAYNFTLVLHVTKK